MDASSLGGRFSSGSNNGLIDLESPLNRHHQRQLGHQPPLNLINDLNSDHQPFGLVELKGSTAKGCLGNSSKSKAVYHFNDPNNENVSEDDEPSCMDDGNGEESNGHKGKKRSTWQRMKWTDDVIRLLITVVACVGDDGNLQGVEGLKRKSGILQRKGKWKAVSKIMIRKGCHVSPQQCEDKFNDLNKRYKRLNDILGRGTSCNVVENHALLDSMPHLSPKAKEDVRKILSSKHLFYREMCAYHNGQIIPNIQDLDLQACALPQEGCSKDNNVSDREENEGQSDSYDESDSEDDNNSSQDEERTVNYAEKEGTRPWSKSGGRNFNIEISGVFEDPKSSQEERKKWIKRQMFQLMEERVSIQAQAFELEEQRFKWLRYCSKKDKEFERLRLGNERMRLDTEQTILQLKQKQVEVEIRKTSASLSSRGISGVRDHQIDLGRHL